MVSYEAIEEFWATWFSAQTNANTQAAKGALHALLGTKPATLESKVLDMPMKKNTEEEIE